MLRNIVVFENKEKLDFRLVRMDLPAGSSPLAIADRHNFAVVCGQHFDRDEIKQYAETQSGYRAAA